jgi:hypothetical protein
MKSLLTVRKRNFSPGTHMFMNLLVLHRKTRRELMGEVHRDSNFQALTSRENVIARAERRVPKYLIAPRPSE